MCELEERGKCQALVLISPRVFFPWLHYTCTNVLALHDSAVLCLK